MAIATRDSMPERKDITEQIERMKREQEEQDRRLQEAQERRTQEQTVSNR